MKEQPLTQKDYSIGIIYSSSKNLTTLLSVLDEEHPKLKLNPADKNEYSYGRIANHNVVIACLPTSKRGTASAATAANFMRRSFDIQLGLMVGEGGGVWTKANDIRLGDVVVSQPNEKNCGVIWTDFGKIEKNDKFRHTYTLSKPPPLLLGVLQSLKAYDMTNGISLAKTLREMAERNPQMAEMYRYQGVEDDKLFKTPYHHNGGETCEACDPMFIVPREPRHDSAPRTHFGTIASGDCVMRSSIDRDEIAKKDDVMCFEMEAAGLMDTFPCLVIRGISNYADSHKNDLWKHYAAAVAAAFAREILMWLPNEEVL